MEQAARPARGQRDLKHIYRKLAVSSRTEALARVRELNLL
jgi:DNA-binding CsgD family transcriptional regulator